MLNREEYLAAWSRWHGGAATDRGLVRAWLTAVHALARPIAGVPPILVTALGLVVAAAAVVPAAAGGGWLVVAGVLVGRPGCWTPSTAPWRSARAGRRGAGSCSIPPSTG